MAKSKTTRRERAERERARQEEAEQAASRRRRRRVLGIGGAALAAVVIAVVAVLLTRGSDDASSPTPATAGVQPKTTELDGIEEHGSVLGSPKAPYTLVEFNDLVCPGCKTYAEQILPAVISRYVKSGKLRIELRPFGFVRDWSTLAAQYAWAAAGQDKMWQFVTAWYANAGDDTTDYVNDGFARRIAATVPGLDADRLIREAHLTATRRKLDDVARGFLTLNQQVVPAFAAGRTGQPVRPIVLGSSAQEATAAIGQLTGS